MAQAKTGFFNKVMGSIVASRQKQVNDVVNSYLASMDEATLKNLGVTRPKGVNRGNRYFF